VPGPDCLEDWLLDRRDFLSHLSLLIGSTLLTPAVAKEAELRFSELYETGVTLTEKAKSLAGQRIVMSGFMAPPLKVEANFFVLTGVPMAVCPFCDSQMDWPNNIALVKTPKQVEFISFNKRIRVEGILETGFVKDELTGFVSFIRLLEASYEAV
jgi:hypothetical protein